MNYKSGILGAGSIGCYIGSHLANKFHNTVFIGRESLKKEAEEFGIKITNWKNESFLIENETDFKFKISPEALSDCKFIFITVKSADTEESAKSILNIIKKNTIVVSFQNGTTNADTLRKILPCPVIAGMVPYNVIRKENAEFHSGTSGELIIEKTGEDSKLVSELLNSSGLHCIESENIMGILWGKLVFNLNNALNALAGIPLKEELSNHNYRIILSNCMKEALEIYRLSGIKVKSLGKMIPWLAPHILNLPDFLFFRIASNMIKIDKEARSSMWEDLSRKRKTEIDYLNGEIVKLADKINYPAPFNRNIVKIIKEIESKGSGSPGYSPEELMKIIKK